MLQGIVGFVVGALFGLLAAIVIVRAIEVPEWAQNDLTGIMVILYVLLVL